MPLELHRMRNTITSSNNLPKSQALELQKLQPWLFSVPTLLAQVWVLLSCVIHSAYWPDEFLFWLIQYNQILTSWYQKPISRRGLVWGFIYLFFGFVLFVFSNSWCDVHPDVMVHTSNLSSWEVESGRLPWVQGHHGLRGKPRAILNWSETLSYKTKRKSTIKSRFLSFRLSSMLSLELKKTGVREIEMGTDLEITLP